MLNKYKKITVLELLNKDLSEIVLMPINIIMAKIIGNTNDINKKFFIGRRANFYLDLKEKRRLIPYNHLGEIPVMVEEIIKLFINNLEIPVAYIYESKKLNTQKTKNLFSETQIVLKLEENDFKVIEDIRAEILLSNEKKYEDMANIYNMLAGLKEIEREGWKIWNVQKESVESDMDHTGSAMGIASSMYMLFPQYKKLDISRVLMMLQFHDLGELIIGDIIVPKQNSEKSAQERKAVIELVKNLDIKDVIIRLWDEFEKKETPEAKFAFMCDKLDAELQAKEYEAKDLVDLNNQPNNSLMHNKKILNLIESEGSWSNMWLEYDLERYSKDYDDTFKEFIRYLKK